MWASRFTRAQIAEMNHQNHTDTHTHTHTHKQLRPQNVGLCLQDVNAKRTEILCLISRWHSGKESTCQCRRHGFHLWVWKTPWRGAWQPPPVFLPGESYGQRSLVGYSPWGHKESDMTEQLTHTFFWNSIPG